MADLLEFGAPALMDLLSPTLQAQLRALSVPVRYEDRQQIHARGDIKPGLSIVRSGAVWMGNPGADGSYVVTSILGPGQSFGEFTLFADLPRTHDAIADGVTIIDQIERGRFERLLDAEPALARKLLIVANKRMHALLEFLDDLRRLPLVACAAKLIWSMSRLSGNRTAMCSQTDLAFTLGVSRVSIGKALSDLQADGVIRIGYGRIDIPDPQKLSAWIADRTTLAPLSA